MKMETVSLETHILEAADLIDSAVEQFLTEMGALLSADAAAMSPVDEGQRYCWQQPRKRRLE